MRPDLSVLWVAASLLQGTGDPLGVRVDQVRPGQDVLNYDIALSIPDQGNAIRGRTTIAYQTPAGGGQLRLDFDTVFTVDSLLILDAKGQARSATTLQWTFARDGQLTVRVPGLPHDTLRVTVVYHGAPSDGLFIRNNAHGERAVFADNWPNRAHHWFPSNDHPSDKATASFAIEVPERWRAVANGTLMGVDTLRSGRTIWRWREERRVPVYTMVIGAGRLAVTPLAGEGRIPSSVWTFPEDSAFAVSGPFRRAATIVDVFTRDFGPFPYEKLAHVESSTRFGGMENSSAIFYDEKKYADRSMDEHVVAHESAHQWFGDAVTEADWHHLWLSEGFAQYFGDEFLESLRDTAGFRAGLEADRRTYFASNVVDRPVIDTAEHNLFRLLNRNNYEKGALILHMLRRVVGDSAFFMGLKTYQAAYRDSTALTSDLAAIMEHASGRNLQAFFRQWLLQPGYPKLYVTTHCRGGQLVVEIEQTQPAAWGNWSIDLPADIGSQRVTIAIRDHLTTYTHPVCGSVTLDPERDYLVEVTVPPH